MNSDTHAIEALKTFANTVFAGSDVMRSAELIQPFANAMIAASEAIQSLRAARIAATTATGQDAVGADGSSGQGNADKRIAFEKMTVRTASKKLIGLTSTLIEVSRPPSESQPGGFPSWSVSVPWELSHSQIRALSDFLLSLQPQIERVVRK
ncbi:hypothetical protein [Rugamonas sp.]|uniref:hypothetical protein n=1 Tax=Rugamonas sp. TaxID=1926287 RepID=UPI0025F86922|nr:hypothetical protein [Rugamonas sp.]